ncbi:hypothetical protein EJ08DRAFT_652465 [Tothia fuscella]|uniref:Exonuclease domain-containing protein n=1 Tax=Tothia fuscella TaxID=1048955 RepID=A0A9P4TVG0_9PEZI|nr:hypothetical protein EJ08DRAFT_652465 [Tothia fuscella]
MFSSSSLFRNIPCPSEAGKCNLVNCIFSHQAILKTSSEAYDINTAVGDQKRRKLENGAKEVTHVSVPQFGVFTGITAPRSALPSSSQSNTPVKVQDSIATTSSPNGTSKVPSTATRPISPPPIGSQGRKLSGNASSKATSKIAPLAKKAQKAETLSPRGLVKDPAPYMTRYQLLQLLHQAMLKLNDAIQRSYDEDISSLYLDKQGLICAALDEEESIARGKPSIYTNMLKNRISAYRKMKLDEWAKIRQAIVAKAEDIQKAEDIANADMKPEETKQKTESLGAVNLEIELSVTQQLVMLNRFVVKTQDLRNAGYVVAPPTDAEMEEARKTVAASAFYEQCDRCNTRFQVFPDGRDEDGAVTTNGKCQHHWGKVRTEKKMTGGTSTSRVIYNCCNETKGDSAGCTVGESHVFKINGVSRMASVLQFTDTPVNAEAKNDFAVSFDCEMAYTTYGLELIRLSATTWPQGYALIDVLVRPIGRILDFNTRFSGVSEEQYFSAKPCDLQKDGPLPPLARGKDTTSSTSLRALRIVSGPAEARTLLLSYISTDTVLIGHSLDNDMNVLRLIHPKIVDTSLLFPHPVGLPYRYGLKNLVKQFLQTDIQMGGATGHDSLEDSRATGDLVRWKVAREWDKLKEQGWTIKDGEFCSSDEAKLVPGLPPYGKSQGVMAKPRKRRHGDSGFQVGTG